MSEVRRSPEFDPRRVREHGPEVSVRGSVTLADAMAFVERLGEVDELTLTEFLLARIAEDEAENVGGVFGRDNYGCLLIQPARALAECEAKRRIVEIASGGVAAIGEGRPHRSFLSGRVHDSAKILAALALPYAYHPDYREEWKP